MCFPVWSPKGPLGQERFFPVSSSPCEFEGMEQHEGLGLDQNVNLQVKQ